MSSNNIDWAERKALLIRALFHDQPTLSPITEDADEEVERVPLLVRRPESPLPELIVEKEPDRHDEPEEFYRQLEVKLKMLYNIMFSINKNRDKTSSYSLVVEPAIPKRKNQETISHISENEVNVVDDINNNNKDTENYVTRDVFEDHNSICSEEDESDGGGNETENGNDQGTEESHRDSNLNKTAGSCRDSEIEDSEEDNIQSACEKSNDHYSNISANETSESCRNTKYSDGSDKDGSENETDYNDPETEDELNTSDHLVQEDTQHSDSNENDTTEINKTFDMLNKVAENSEYNESNNETDDGDSEIEVDDKPNRSIDEEDTKSSDVGEDKSMDVNKTYIIPNKTASNTEMSKTNDETYEAGSEMDFQVPNDSFDVQDNEQSDPNITHDSSKYPAYKRSPTFTQEEKKTAKNSINSFDEYRELNNTRDDNNLSEDSDNESDIVTDDNEDTNDLFDEDDTEESEATDPNTNNLSSVSSKDGADPPSERQTKSMETMRHDINQNFHTSSPILHRKRKSNDSDPLEPDVNIDIDEMIDDFNDRTVEDRILAGSFLEREVEDSNPELQLAFRTSTPEIEADGCEDGPSPSKVIRSEDVSEADVNWDNIKTDFFGDSCKVFNLCRCKNHVCDDF